MGRIWRPVLVGAAVVVTTFVLAKAQVFEPQAATEPAGAGDVYRGETVFQRECVNCHGQSGEGGVGPRLAGAGLDAAAVTSALRGGRGVMPAGLVSGREEADVVAYVVGISTP
jgi:cytochrome c551